MFRVHGVLKLPFTLNYSCHCKIHLLWTLNDSQFTIFRGNFCNIEKKNSFWFSDERKLEDERNEERYKDPIPSRGDAVENTVESTVVVTAVVSSVDNDRLSLVDDTLNNSVELCVDSENEVEESAKDKTQNLFEDENTNKKDEHEINNEKENMINDDNNLDKIESVEPSTEKFLHTIKKEDSESDIALEVDPELSSAAHAAVLAVAAVIRAATAATTSVLENEKNDRNEQDKVNKNANGKSLV